MESRMTTIKARKKGLLKLSKPLKFMAERGRFELPVPFEYTRFPIVLYRIRYNTAAQTRRTNTKEYYILFQYIMINKFSTLTAMTHLIIW